MEVLKEKVDNKQAPFNPSKNGSIQLVELSHRHGSARAIAAAFGILSISTPYVLIGQHDNFFVRDVSYLRSLLQYMEEEDTKSWLQCVHFPSTATLNYVQKVKRRYDLDISPFCVDIDDESSFPNIHGSFIPLVFWYGRTNLGRTKYYNSILKRFPNLQVSDHLEELLGTQQLNELQEIKGKNVDLEDEFRKVHATYGNYVFFDNRPFPGTEVLYHMSGRKVCAATKNSTTTEQEKMTQHTVPSGSNDATNNSSSCFNPHVNSFTTARRSIAKVPGLEFITNSAEETNDRNNTQKKKFKQNCFHCGKKGHSFKFCPSIQEEENGMPRIDVLQI